MSGPIGTMLGRAWPAPVLKPMGPFFVAGIIVAVGVYKFAGVLMETDEWRNDARHPAVKSGQRPAVAPPAAH
ncbi:ATP synthase j chain-domain-containing protein [Terfezia claveryi]|nr:ATP synthase j chain-domain-containing protein [Terfezia claveryi]